MILELENEIYDKGYKYIACIDEVGRGCLAGDVLSCAIIMPKNLVIEGVKDSKKLTEKKRIGLNKKILETAIAVGIGRASVEEIESINIKEATRLSMKRAVEDLKDKEGRKVNADFLLIDAEDIYMDIDKLSITKGDSRSHGISCASIVAKVYRDDLCNQWDMDYPGYNIKKHKGYGTKEHRENIVKLGPSAIHRRSFLKNILK